MKLFLDANVVFSAANSESQLHRFILLLGRDQMLVTSGYAQQEAYRNIRAKRPLWEEGYRKVMAGVAVVEGIDRPVPVSLARKDRPILATAIRERCEYLVTGDKRDFGHLFGATIEGVTVMSPLMLAGKLVEQGEL